MKFTIRDLFLVTVIVALVLGWWLDRSRVAEDMDEWKFRTEVLAESLDNLGHKARWDKEGVGVRYLKDLVPNSQAPAPNP